MKIKQAWAMFVQTTKEVEELGVGLFDSYEGALKEAKARAGKQLSVDHCVGVRRCDVCSPSAEERERILLAIEDASNGENVEDKRARAKKILAELIRLELLRKAGKKSRSN